MPTMILTPEQRIRQRYRWFEVATQLGNVTVACERCGVSRKTFYKWRKRFTEARGALQAILARAGPAAPPHSHLQVSEPLRAGRLYHDRRDAASGWTTLRPAIAGKTGTPW
jgi:transposase-like protein